MRSACPLPLEYAIFLGVINKTRIYRSLQTWYKNQSRVLPWRTEPSFYRVWVSEIMLQQTQVVTVVPYFDRFMKKFPTVEKLAQASEESVLSAWAGLGYYSRARNLKKTAHWVVFENQSQFPTTRPGWESLPGVGPYTAGAILSIADNQCEAILDGNVERVLSRFFRVNRAKGDAAYKKRLWKLSWGALKAANRCRFQPRDFNQALMELGALVCTPKSPKCESCPLQSGCRAFKNQDAEAYPPKKAPQEWKKVFEKDFLLIDAQGRVLIEKNEAGQWRAGLWDLPRKLPPAMITNKKPDAILETHHVVTRHRITRETHVYEKLKTQKSLEQNRKWVHPFDSTVPLGASIRRVLKAAQSRGFF